MRKALSTVGLLVLSFISAPSFSHGNEKYSACELSRIVSGRYGGKAENAIFYCWNPNDPDAGIGIGIPGSPDMIPMEEMPNIEPMEMPEGPMERPEVPMEMPSFDETPSEMSPADMSPAGRIVENQDFNGDQLIGGKIEVVRTIFPGNDKFDRGLYEFKATKSSGSEIYGGLVISGMGLQPGDTILENDTIKILDNQSREFPAYRDVIAMYTITRGIALSYYKNSVLMEQAFGFRRKENILRPFGKPRKATENPKMGGDICYREERMDYDFDGNLIIGCN